MTSDNFAALGLAEPILDALTAEKHEIPTPIQAQAIPEVMAGRDLLGLAQTGTGKTAAFTLPILHRLKDMPRQLTPKTAHVLILAPTRELAVQIGERAQAYGRNMRLKQAIILGGVSQHRQVQSLARGVDILIATPGRLLDLVNQRHLRLDQTSILVLDEADRMFDMGFIVKVRQIVAMLPQKRQTLMFSATMPPDIAKLAHEILQEPVRVEVTPQQVTADRIEQSLYYVDLPDKKMLLTELLAKDSSMERVIVFTRTKYAADRIATFVSKAGVRAESLHGDKTQNARQRSLEQFRNGSARVLVATDIAARGIDVSNVTHVVNYDLPNEAESYVHRIGRTARAGSEGRAISFCDASERHLLRDIEKLTKQQLNVVGGDVRELTPMPPVGTRKGGGRPQMDRAHDRPRDGNSRPYTKARALGQAQHARPRTEERSRPEVLDEGVERGAGHKPHKPQARKPITAGHGPRPEGRYEGQGAGRNENRGYGRFENRGEGRSENRGEGRSENRGEGRSENRGEGRGENRGEGRGENRGEGRNEGQRGGRYEGQGAGRSDNRGQGRFENRGEGRGENRGEGRSENRYEERPRRFDDGRPAERGDGRAPKRAGSPGKNRSARDSGAEARFEGRSEGRSERRPDGRSGAGRPQQARPQGGQRPPQKKRRQAA